MNFLDTYIGPRNIRKLSLDEFLVLQKTIGGRPGFKMVEYINANQPVRAYYDYDVNLQRSEAEDPATADEQLHHYQNFQSIMERLHPNKEVAYAERHGLKIKKNRNGQMTHQYQCISFRSYVQSIGMKPTDIKQHILNTFGGNVPEGLDIIPYKATDQCLGVTQAHKNDYDFRILRPVTHIDRPEAFVTQNLPEDAELLHVTSSEVSSPAKKVHKSSSLVVSRNPQNYISINVRLGLDDQRRLIMDWDHVLPKLQEIGFKGIEIVSKRHRGYAFDADRTCPCVLCTTRTHDSNNWYIDSIIPEMFIVKNYSPECQARLIGFDEPAGHFLHEILMMPDTDRDYAGLFAQVYKGCIFWTSAGRFVYWKGNSWAEFPQEMLKDLLYNFLSETMKRMARFANEKRLLLEMDKTGAKDEELKKWKLYCKNCVVGVRYLKKRGNMWGIVDFLKSDLYSHDFEKDLDRNPYLLGVANGVIDLKTCKFRPAEPRDMVSRSTGYSYLDQTMEEYDADTMQEVRAFFKRILPVDEELEMLQRWCGYCMLGRHLEKYFAILTDVRGGYNGKSKLCKALSQALGPDYCCDGGDNSLLYKDDYHQGKNGHAAGMLAFDLFRLGIFEELDPNRELDNELQKKLNGSGASYRGRQFRSEKVTEFPWSMKQILNCNKGKFPRFDWTDDPLVTRILVFRFRSKFYNNAEEYEAHKDDPHTFLSEMVDEKLEGEWKPYLLLWLLEGLARYNDVGFSVIPSVCKDWRNGLVAQRDTVTPWLNDNVSNKGQRSDYVTRIQLYRRFKAEVDEERNRKTQLGEGAFFEKVKEIWGMDGFYERKKVAGTTLRCVWFGRKFRLGEASDSGGEN